MKTQQEIHLVPVRLGLEAPPAQADPTANPAALRVGSDPVVLAADLGGPTLAGASGPTPRDAVVVEPFVNPLKQLRLLARFPEQVAPAVNGEPAARLAVLSPGDFFQWTTGVGFRVALFSKPCLGPPPEAVHGQPCPVCRVPFVPETTCYACACGVVLHCEADEKHGLQCAQLRRECPACKRPVVLTEGYLDASSHED